MSATPPWRAAATRRRVALLALIVGSVGGPSASASPELAQRHNCLGCHAVDKEVVGPAYQAVARRYKGRKDAQATLVANIRSGGSGKWGSVPMPPQPSLSDTDATTLAHWILSLAR